MRARSPAPPEPDRLVKTWLAAPSYLSLHIVFQPEVYGISSNFTKFGKGFLKPSLYPALRGAGYVWRYFQPQSDQTQEASGHPCPARDVGRVAGGAADAGSRSLARRHAHQAD